jgi:hypothetical protein
MNTTPIEERVEPAWAGFPSKEEMMIITMGHFTIPCCSISG